MIFDYVVLGLIIASGVVLTLHNLRRFCQVKGVKAPKQENELVEITAKRIHQTATSEFYYLTFKADEEVELIVNKKTYQRWQKGAIGHLKIKNGCFVDFVETTNYPSKSEPN